MLRGKFIRDAIVWFDAFDVVGFAVLGNCLTALPHMGIFLIALGRNLLIDSGRAA